MQALARGLLVLLLPLAVECAANKGTVAWVWDNVPTVHSCNAERPDWPATASIDGNASTFWDAAWWGVPNWIVYDFGAPQYVTGFSFTCLGDILHGVKNWELETSASGGGPWTVVASGVGVSGSDTPQVASFAGTTGRFWRFNVLTRFSQYQVWLREVQFTGCPTPRCPQEEGPAEVLVGDVQPTAPASAKQPYGGAWVVCFHLVLNVVAVVMGADVWHLVLICFAMASVCSLPTCLLGDHPGGGVNWAFLSSLS